jgi:hypothetical protein
VPGTARPVLAHPWARRVRVDGVYGGDEADDLPVLDGDDAVMARISEELRGALLVDRIVENVRRPSSREGAARPCPKP